LRIFQERTVLATDGSGDDVVEVLLALAVALHWVEAQFKRRDIATAIGAADNFVDRALDGQWTRLYQLGPAEYLVILGEIVHLVGVADGDQFDELPVILTRQPDALLVSNAPHDWRVHCAANVRMQLGKSGTLRQDARRGHAFLLKC